MNISRKLYVIFALSLHLKISEGSTEKPVNESLNEVLSVIQAVRDGNNLCLTSPAGANVQVLPIQLSTQKYDSTRQKVDLLGNIIRTLGYEPKTDLYANILRNLILSQPLVIGAKLAKRLEENTYLVYSAVRSPGVEDFHVERGSYPRALLLHQPWFTNRFADPTLETVGNRSSDNWWSPPYYSCDQKKWLLSYTTQLFPRTGLPVMLSTDIDVSYLDINQCQRSADDIPKKSQIIAFNNTHKCDSETTECHFVPGNGWARGSYNCVCRDGFYSSLNNPKFNGSLVEVAWKDFQDERSAAYSILYVCKKCAPGCSTCINNSPCLADYNWAFRTSLLVISIVCIVFTLILIGFVYKYRRLKVLKLASPIFLCITLIGCAIMYSETATIFPILDMYSCIAVKWTRHMGFCVTYSALLLKTWRVSLTYRVKSAHKLKLTDKQLIQWLFPVLLLMVMYLSAWTLSSPPEGVDIFDTWGLKFKQCSYDWWDHSLAIGEFIFLLWGIKVCFNLRRAESLYNEARHVSFAIYNIAVVNIIMVTFHLLIFPTAGPDIKFVLGFLRGQLSTTTTIILIFGPKFYRIIRGAGDQYDNRVRAKGVSASFSLNGIGIVQDENVDLYQENEELKEELQKLSAQIEFMKIVHMEVNNRHLKPKKDSYFHPSHINYSSVSGLVRKISLGSKTKETGESPSKRLSPAAELISNRV